MIQKTAQTVGDLIGYKFADKIAKVSRISPQNTTEAVPSETKDKKFDVKIPKVRYISPEDRQQIIEYPRLIQCNVVY